MSAISAIVALFISVASIIFSVGAYYTAINWKFKLVNHRLRQHDRELSDLRKLVEQCLKRPVSARYTEEDRLNP